MDFGEKYFCNFKNSINGFQLIKKHIKVLIVDLWCAWNQDHKLYLGVSRRYSDYIKNKRYGKLKLGYRSMIKVLDGLKKKKYIEQEIGWLDRSRGIGRNTKILSTKKLMTFYQLNSPEP